MSEEASIVFVPRLKKPEIKNAAEVVAELRWLEERNGQITAPDVVQHASDTRSAMHQYFEWDDSEAAKEYRLDQARALITSVRVRIDTMPERGPMRAFVHIPAAKPYYASAAKAMADEVTRDMVIAKALRELESVRARYADIVELAEVFERIDAIAARLTPPPAQRGAPILG